MFQLYFVFTVCAFPFLCSQLNGELAPADLKHATTFLKKFGYLHKHSKNDPESLTDAVSAMQKFAGLEVTGEINAKTMAKMRSKRCGLPDMDASSGRAKRYVVVRKWSYLNFTYNVLKYPPKKSPCLTDDVYNQYVIYAFKNWSTVLTKLTISKALDGKNGTFRLGSGSLVHDDKFSFDGQGDTLAHAFYPESGKIDFDADEQWGCYQEPISKKRGAAMYTYFMEVMLHELGHALGLGHSEVDTAVMAPYYNGDKETLSLSPDDIDGMKALYNL